MPPNKALIFAAFVALTQALNPVIKIVGQGMQLLGPIFSLENKLQGALLGAIGKVDVDDIREELDNLKLEPCVIYTYKLSPFSTEAIAVLEAAGAKYEKREVGLEWFLLGPRASVLRSELLDLTGQSSMPHIFIGGEHIGGLSTGTPGLSALVESGELEDRLIAAKASSKYVEPEKKSSFFSSFKNPF